MAISINDNTNKNAVEVFNEMTATGKKCEFITDDSCGEIRNIGFVVSENEEDRKNAEKFFKYISTASNGNIYEMMHKMMTVATITEKGIEPDEMMNICGKDVMLSYANGKAYTMDGEEIANCDDLPDMPKDAIKAVLIERAKNC
jgi:hypothetical protein